MTEMYSGLHVGQRFSSLEDFKTFIRSISVRQHWDLRVVRSNKKSVVLGCRSSPNCFFRVVCRANKHATYITSLQDTHSCRRNAASSGATPARSEASHVRFLLNEIPKLFDMKSKIKGQDVVEAVKRYHGYDISMRQAQRALTKLQPRQSRAHPDNSPEDEDEDDAPQSQSAPPAPIPPGNETAFTDLTEDRWPHDGLSPTLMEGGDMDQDDSPPDSTAPRQSHTQPVSNISHHNQASPSESMSVSHHAPQINALSPTPQPFVQPPQNQLPASQSNPKPQRQQQPPPPAAPPQPQSGHPAAPHLVLTNFKIEFTCTTCGALNQSFFPNQGNVTGNSYLPPHPVPHQNNHRGQPVGAVNDGAGHHSADGFNDEDYQGDPTSHSRSIPSPWAPGGLDVPIPPANG
jgi:hypothetical protein